MEVVVCARCFRKDTGMLNSVKKIA